MAKKQYYYSRGDVVSTLIPHKENLKIIEKRTTLVILRSIFGNLTVLRITSQDKKYHEPFRIPLYNKDLLKGKKLKDSPSYILLHESFTIGSELIEFNIGKVNKNKMDYILKKYRELYK